MTLRTMRVINAIGLAALLTAAVSSSARADVISTFDLNDEGWKAVGLPLLLGNPPAVKATASPTYHASGGNPGGHISATDSSLRWNWFSAPAAFLGDHSASFGDTLSFDLKSSNPGLLPRPDVILAGNGTTLYHWSTQPGTTWGTHSIALSAAGNWYVGNPLDLSPTLATAAQIQGALGGVTALYIDSDWRVGFNETVSLDNVRLGTRTVTPASVPEPGSLALLGAGAASLLGFAWRKKRRGA